MNFSVKLVDKLSIQLLVETQEITKVYNRIDKERWLVFDYWTPPEVCALPKDSFEE